MNKLIFGHIIFSDHAIHRYKTRYLEHKGFGYDELSIEDIKGRILKQVSFRNVKKIVNFGDEFKFVFTKNNLEFRFKRSNSKNKDTWILQTVVRYVRVLPWEEPIDIDLDNVPRGQTQRLGIGVAIKVREKQKLEYEKEQQENAMV